LENIQIVSVKLNKILNIEAFGFITHNYSIEFQIYCN